MRREDYPQVAFLLCVFALLLQAQMLNTGGQEPSILDGLYLPVVGLLASYVVLYLSGASLQRFAVFSLILTVTLSVLPAIKYQYLYGGDVNFMYRIIESVFSASSFSGIQNIPDTLRGIYQNFPGFIILNVLFLKVTGLPVLEGYKILFPILYGILYPGAFFLMSGILTESARLKRAILVAASIPYALLPGAPWNYFMMPNYFAFLLLLTLLALALRKLPGKADRHSFRIIFIIILTTIIVTHPLASLYSAVVFSGLLLVRAIMRRRFGRPPDSLLSTPLVLFSWIGTFGWTIYSSVSQLFFRETLSLSIIILLEGLRVPSVTQRLQVGGPGIFLVTHPSKLILCVMGAYGLLSIARRKISEAKIGIWTTSSFFLIFLVGVAFFAVGYSLYDIYVGYRSLFLSMIVLILAAGLGLFTLSQLSTLRQVATLRTFRHVALGLFLVAILTGSLFELYPTEYVNPSINNAVHTIYQKDTIGFLSRHWTFSSQILPDTQTYQVAQSYASVMVFDDIIPHDEVRFYRIDDPFTTIISANELVSARSNLIYNSGFTIVNSTLR